MRSGNKAHIWDDPLSIFVQDSIITANGPFHSEKASQLGQHMVITHMIGIRQILKGRKYSVKSCERILT